MTDAEFAAMKERVFALAQKWQKALGLAWWSIDYVWLREMLPTTPEDDKAGLCVAAQCDAQWQYLKATITVSLPSLTDKTDEQIERIMVHELMHVLVNETEEADGWLKHQERVVSTLTAAVFWLLAAQGRSEVQTRKVSRNEHRNEPIAARPDASHV